MTTHLGQYGMVQGPYGGQTACGKYLTVGPTYIRPFHAFASYADMPEGLKTRYPAARREKLPTCNACASEFVQMRDARRAQQSGTFA